MLASIHPLGERARGRSWGVTVSAYVIGSTAAGAMLGLTLGTLGSVTIGGLPPTWRVLLLAGTVLIGMSFDLPIAELSLPSWKRQVNEDWLVRYRGWVYGLGFGFQLGLGVVTIVTSAAVYATFAVAFLTASPTAGFLIGGVFGLTRASTIFAASYVRRPAQLRSFHRSMHRRAPWARRAAVAVQAAVLIAALLAI